MPGEIVEKFYGGIALIQLLPVKKSFVPHAKSVAESP
jgi:hypothetical protein